MSASDSTGNQWLDEALDDWDTARQQVENMPARPEHAHLIAALLVIASRIGELSACLDAAADKAEPE